MRTLALISILFLIVTSGFSQGASNKNVVFIHGAWSTGEVWNNYKAYFEEQHYTTLSPTFRFHSHAKNDSLTGVSMADYVTDLRKILKTFENPPIVVAHSMGCIIAQRLAEEGLIGKMILIAPPVNYGMMPPSSSIKSLQWATDISHLNRSLVKPNFDQAVSTFLYNLPKAQQQQVYAKMTNESGEVLKELVWIKNLFGKKPNKINYSKIHVPILFISGGIDKASPKKIAEKLAKKYKTKTDLKVFDTNAHWLMEELNWKEVAVFINHWIQNKQVLQAKASRNYSQSFLKHDDLSKE